MTFRRWMPSLLFLLLIPGCATVEKNGHIERAKPSSFAFLNNYKSALHDFEQGRLMEARAKIMAMDKSREDYRKARRLLVKKIDPARRKMLQFYLDRARARERAGKWRLAARDFGQAAYFSIKPKQWLRQQRRLEMKIRQHRFNLLRNALQREDRHILGHPRAFTPPKELTGDELLKKWQQERWDKIDDRVQEDYRKASGLLRRGFPELALAYIQSALRLAPGDGRAQRLMVEIKKKLPREISLAPVRMRRPQKQRAVRRSATVHVKNAKEIWRLMVNRQWAKARKYALAWKRQHGKDADAILAAQAKQAKRLSDMGRQAVREERLADAVSLWQQAVALAPDNDEYTKALEWAQQMQERLRLLRSGANTKRKNRK